MEAFVYEWLNILDGMRYIGVHKGSQVDGYVCSSKYFLEEYNNCPEMFSRNIIAFGTREEMWALERQLLVSVNAASNNFYYNRHNGGTKFVTRKGHIPWNKGKKGVRVCSDETRAKMSKSHSKRIRKPHSEETKKRISESLKGKKLPLEHRMKISASISGEKHPLFGKNHSDDHRRKISEALKGKPRKTKGN